MNLFFQKALENLVASKQEIRYFYHNKYKIDFLVEKEKITAIEVKLEARKLKQLKKFSQDKNFSKKLGNCIFVDLERESEEDGIKIIPAWKFALLTFI